MKKIIAFDIDIRPLTDPCGIPIDTVSPDSFQMRSDGVFYNGKLYLWETLQSVKISPIFEGDI